MPIMPTYNYYYALMSSLVFMRCFHNDYGEFVLIEADFRQSIWSAWFSAFFCDTLENSIEF